MSQDTDEWVTINTHMADAVKIRQDVPKQGINEITNQSNLQNGGEESYAQRIKRGIKTRGRLGKGRKKKSKHT